MDEYVITIGNSGLQTWWQVAVVAILAAMYIIANIIPAATLLCTSIRQREFSFETPLLIMLMLVPLIGSLIGLMSYQEDERTVRALLALLYALFISVIASLIEMC